MKRKRGGRETECIAHKRTKLSQGRRKDSATEQHPVLQTYYPRVCRLRAYLLSQLGGTSKTRRRLLRDYGLGDDSDDGERMRDLLDTTFIGTFDVESDLEISRFELDQEFSVFSQQISESTGKSHSSGTKLSQSEVGYGVLDICCHRAPLSIILTPWAYTRG